MFGDNTNLFCSHNGIKIFSENANNELKRISQWFQANKLFHKPCATKKTYHFSFRILKALQNYNGNYNEIIFALA